jgi:hypothetical protein
MKPAKPSATRVASTWSSRQGSRIIWRGMRLTLPPGAIGVAKRLAAAQEEIDEQLHAYDGSYQELLHERPELRKIHDKKELYKDSLLRAISSSFRKEHVGIYWSRRKAIAEKFAVMGWPKGTEPKIRPNSTWETYALLEGIDPGKGDEPTLFWDESEVVFPEGTPIKVRNITFWGSALSTALEDVTYDMPSLTVKA